LILSQKFDIRYLATQEYSDWDQFTDHSPQGTLFSKSYWLESVSDSFRIVGCFRDQELIGGIAFEEQKLSGMKFLRNPQLTQFIGFHFLDNSKMNHFRKESLERDIILDTLDFLEPKYKRIAINNHYSINDIRMFTWRNYNPVVRYSFLINLSSRDDLLKEMEQRTRYNIKKSEKKGIQIISEDNLSNFHNLHEMTYKRQGLKCPVSESWLKKIYQNLKSLNKCRIYFARDAAGTILSTAFIVWDGEIAYYLMGAVNYEMRDQGSANLLLWKVMMDLKEMSVRCFDLYGANTPSIALFKRGFGGKLRAYYRVRKINSSLMNLLFNVVESIKRS
jgi:hypothetical protein